MATRYHSACWLGKHLADEDLCIAVLMTYAKQIHNFSPAYALCGRLVATGESMFLCFSLLHSILSGTKVYYEV